MNEGKHHFVDTNILVYAHDISAGVKRQRASDLISHLWKSQEGCLSIQVLQEFYYISTVKIQQPLESHEASRIISLMSAWKIHAPSIKDVLRAIEIQQRLQLSFWDALIINSASQLGCAVLWSEDLNNGQVYEGVRVQNPFNEKG